VGHAPGTRRATEDVHVPDLPPFATGNEPQHAAVPRGRPRTSPSCPYRLRRDAAEKWHPVDQSGVGTVSAAATTCRATVVAQTVRLAPGGLEQARWPRRKTISVPPLWARDYVVTDPLPSTSTRQSARTADDTLGLSKETVTLSLPQPAATRPPISQHRVGVLPAQAHNLWIDDPDGLPAALDDGIPRSLVCAAGECRAALE
jgi:hypothetical protein